MSRLQCPASVGLAAAFGLVSGTCAFGADWPTYLHDMARSGVTTETLSVPLSEEWVFDSPNPPAPGWGQAEQGTIWNCNIPFLQAVRHDDSFHVAVVGDDVFSCSSAENKVYCIDAASASIKWVAFTNAPPRLAPTVSGGYVYVGADDGCVYCLNASDGSEVWKFGAAPQTKRVIGQGSVMSVWPVRTGVVVDGGTAYFGAGLYANKGLYLYAVNAADGSPVWANGSYAGDVSEENITSQGYLLASASEIYLPSGRTMPAVFNRADGSFKYKIGEGRSGPNGGSYTVLAGTYLYNGTSAITAYDLVNTGLDPWGHIIYGPKVWSWALARCIVVNAGTVYMVSDTDIFAVPEADVFDAVGSEVGFDTNMSPDWGKCAWRTPGENVPDTLILANGTLFAGGDGKVCAYDAATGANIWTGTVDGSARGLAVAGGRLLVSTTTGKIYSFTSAGGGATITPPAVGDPYPADGMTAFYDNTADAIVSSSGVTRGHCLILGGGTGRLAYELATRTDLKIHVLEPDAGSVAQARQALHDAGVYGVRICVEQGTLDSLPYPPYFANLIVSQEVFFGGSLSTPAWELSRVLRPCGGVAFVGQPAGGDAFGDAVAPETVSGWCAGLGGATTTNLVGAWGQVTRGKLPGSREWSHNYADAGNSGGSEDRRVAAPFDLLWFGDPDTHDMMDRHSRSPTPLVVNGRMFVQGNEVVMAYDAYNGTLLWRLAITGAKRNQMPYESSNLAVATDDSFFVAVGDECLRLDGDTGATVYTYPLPPRGDTAPRRWGWVATSGGLLLGSRADTDQQFRDWPEPQNFTSEAVFALDIATGNLEWLYEGTGIEDNCIAAGEGKVFFLDKNVTPEQAQQATDERIGEVGESNAEFDHYGNPIEPDIRKLVALDMATGVTLWERGRDVADCSVDPAGGSVHVMYKNGIVLVCGGAFHQDHQFTTYNEGGFERRNIAAFDSRNGSKLWGGPKNYRTRGLIMGDMVYAEPWAFSLTTGAQRMIAAAEPWTMDRGYGGCGAQSASAHTIFMRDSFIAYAAPDDTAAIVALVAGQRPNCWVSFVPAGGVVTAPEGSSQCTCLFSIQGSVVLCPANDNIPPMIVSVGSASNTTVTVVFSEPVATASAETASNYEIDNGILVTAASVGPDGRTVTLTTTILTDMTTYTLTVNNVQDGEPEPKTIPPGFEAEFTTGGGATPTDSDGDGLPDTWEITYFDDLDEGAADDPDVDEFDNMQEYLDGTDPTRGPDTITVTVPDGGENWTAGLAYDVMWTTTGTVGDVDIAYSADGGTNWTDIAMGETNDGTYSWAIPAGIDSTQCRVRVQEAGGDPTDTSDNDFTISPAGDPDTITVTVPNGGETWTAGSAYDVTWTTTGTVGNVDIAYSTDGGTNWTDIATGEANDGTYSWAIPAGIDSTQCRVRVQEADGDPTDTSDNDFTIRKPSTGDGDDDGGCGCVVDTGACAAGAFLAWASLVLACTLARRKWA